MSKENSCSGGRNYLQTKRRILCGGECGDQQNNQGNHGAEEEAVWVAKHCWRITIVSRNYYEGGLTGSEDIWLTWLKNFQDERVSSSSEMSSESDKEYFYFIDVDFIYKIRFSH